MGDLSEVKADVTKVETVVGVGETKATSWVVAHAHEIVTSALVAAVAFILHKIL